MVNADLANGLLTISLIKEVPEAMKPKKIAIGSAKADGAKARSTQVLQHKNEEDSSSLNFKHLF